MFAVLWRQRRNWLILSRRWLFKSFRMLEHLETLHFQMCRHSESIADVSSLESINRKTGLLSACWLVRCGRRLDWELALDVLIGASRFLLLYTVRQSFGCFGLVGQLGGSLDTASAMTRRSIPARLS